MSMCEKIALSVSPDWDRQPGETATQFLWFTRYRDARIVGKSMADVRKEHGKKPSYDKILRYWSSRNRWTARIDAYQAFLEQEKLRARLRAIDRALEEHPKLARGLQAAGAHWLAAQNQDFSKLSPGEARLFIADGIRLERALLGIPLDSGVQTQVNIQQNAQNSVQVHIEALQKEIAREFPAYIASFTPDERERTAQFFDGLKDYVVKKVHERNASRSAETGVCERPVYDPKREYPLSMGEYEQEMEENRRRAEHQTANITLAFVQMLRNRKSRKLEEALIDV